MLLVAIELNTQLEQAIAALTGGDAVAFPTDTFYALGANALDAAAVERVYRLKGRSSGAPLPIFIARPELLERVAEVDRRALAIAAAHWPGPLTLVLRAKPHLPPNLVAGAATVGVRIPAHSAALKLLASVDFPVVSTSANPSATPPLKTAAEVRAAFGERIGCVVAGECGRFKHPSTVVDVTGAEPRVVRRGALDPELILGAGAGR